RMAGGPCPRRPARGDQRRRAARRGHRPGRRPARCPGAGVRGGPALVQRRRGQPEAAMILELDIGNSRIKWRTLAGGLPVARRQCGRASPEGPGLSPQEGVERPRVASVGGAVVAATLAAWARDRLRREPESAAVERTCAGVTTGYAVPGRLGVDRWLALRGAWR